MKKIRLTQTPQFLTHHVPLRAGKMARLTLPTDLTLDDAKRLAVIVQALVMDQDEIEDVLWPYPGDDDPDGDRDSDAILAGLNEFDELDDDDDDQDGEDDGVTVVQSSTFYDQPTKK